MKSANQSSAHRAAYTTATSPQQPGNGGRPMKPQPRRHWLAAIFTVFALLTAGGAHAQMPVVTITDSTTAEYTNAAVTFTLGFSEPVTGFGDDSYTVGGSLTYTSTPSSLDASTTYTSTDPITIVATPLANTNDGVLTITVPAAEVTSLSPSLGNALTVATQKYDTMAPTFIGTFAATTFVGDDADTVIYTAVAIDGGVDDTGITYSLDTSTNEMKFDIDPTSGEVKYKVSPTLADVTPDITPLPIRVFATDKGGNRAGRVVRFSIEKPTRSVVEITNNTTADYTNAAVTFTLSFTEAAIGFDADSYTVEGSLTYTITSSLDATATYTLTDTITIVHRDTACRHQ